MPEITVFPHGDRWAVAERGAESPLKEFPTREAAELSAGQLAEGGSVEVLDEDPTSLDHAEPRDAGEPADAATGGGHADTPPDAREPQAGL
jgi:hypothetical protein